MLAIKAVSKQFGGLRALNDVSFEVNAHQIHGLMGANGAGKTTLFSIIAGHQTPSAGRVEFNGQHISGLRPDQICRLGIARTFQIVRPFSNLTVRENVETAVQFGRFAMQAPSEPTRPEVRTSDILERTQLTEQAHKLARTLTLSGRKRLELARALGSGPKLLLLDEIMAGLTATEVREMISTVAAIKQEYQLTIVIVEHVVAALSEMSDTITVLHHGEMIAQGSPAEIARNATVQQAYFGELA